MLGNQGYWRLAGDGEDGMHSHAGAWEREYDLTVIFGLWKVTYPVAHSG